MAAVLTLPPVLDIQTAGSLRTDLLALQGQDVVLDGSGAERLGGLCLQVLLSARQTWARDGRELALEPVSEAFADQWNRFGAPAWGAGHTGASA